MAQNATAVQIKDVSKSFRVPTHRVETFKERALHPLRSVAYTELHALDDVSFEIGGGEFFGIAGRNGSGKTTLLKLLASIYRPDRGSLRIAGRVAPFIELGVGFNPDLAARDNIQLNGVMMGLTPKEAHARADRVIEFAELEEFTELKLKNYSSGMRVRLGFAMLVEADADVLLIDEVLAVGDAAFQQKCTDVFYEFKKQGRTIVLVTHAMEKLREYCDRAVLLHGGRLEEIGDPEKVGERYLELNFKSSSSHEFEQADQTQDHTELIRVIDFWFENAAGERCESFHHGESIGFCAELEAVNEIRGAPSFGITIDNQNGARMVEIRSPDLAAADEPLSTGERVRVRGTIDNPLASGRYTSHLGVTRHHDDDDAICVKPDAGQFVVYGVEAPWGFSGAIVPGYEFTIERTGAAPRLASVSEDSFAGNP